MRKIALLSLGFVALALTACEDEQPDVVVPAPTVTETAEINCDETPHLKPCWVNEEPNDDSEVIVD